MNTVDECTGTSVQRAIDATESATVFVPKNVYDLGYEPILVFDHRVQIICEPGTVFWYRGPGAAIQVGHAFSNIEGFKLSGCEISLADNDNDDACCLKLIRSFWATLQDLRLTSSNGASRPRQKGLMISGGATDEAGFSAYTLILNIAVIGSFEKGIWFGSEIPGGPSTQDRSNANTVIGGSVYCGAQDKTGSIGIHIEHGDTNRILGTDHDSLETGTKIDGHANQVNARYENISKYAIHVGPTSQGSFIFGSAIPAGEWLDEGYETQYILTSQNGVNKSCLSDLSARYSFTLIPRDGTPNEVRDGMMWYDWNDEKVHVCMGGQVKSFLWE